MNRLIIHLAQVIPNSKYFDLINTWLNDEKMFETKFYEKSTQMNYFLMKKKTEPLSCYLLFMSNNSFGNAVQFINNYFEKEHLIWMKNFNYLKFLLSGI